MIPYREACRRFGVHPNVARTAIVRGDLDAKLIPCVMTYAVDPEDFALFAKQIGERKTRGARMVKALQAGATVRQVAEQFGITAAGVHRAINRRGFRSRDFAHN